MCVRLNGDAKYQLSNKSTLFIALLTLLTMNLNLIMVFRNIYNFFLNLVNVLYLKTTPYRE